MFSSGRGCGGSDGLGWRAGGGGVRREHWEKIRSGCAYSLKSLKQVDFIWFWQIDDHCSEFRWNMPIWNGIICTIICSDFYF